MTYRNERESNLAAQILMFLLFVGLFSTANNDENHWSVRVACAAILAVLPLALFFGVAGSAFSDALRANDITDIAWGLALLFSIFGLFVVGWVGYIVYRCVDAMSEANGWLVIPTGVSVASLAVYWLWGTSIGWWKVLAIPAVYFACCVFAEGLFNEADGAEPTNDHDSSKQQSENDPTRSRSTLHWSISVAVLVMAIGTLVYSSLDSRSVDAEPLTSATTSDEEAHALSLELGAAYWPLVRNALGLPSTAPFDPSGYEVIAVGFTAESIGTLTIFEGDYFVFFEAIAPDQEHVLGKTLALRPRSARDELYAIMQARHFELEAIISEDLRDQLNAQISQGTGR